LIHHNRLAAGPLAAQRTIRADDRQPGVLGVPDLCVVAVPVQRDVAPTVVGGDQQGGLVPVLCVGLQPVPKLAEHGIISGDGGEHAVVSFFVRPVVSLAKAEIKNARPVGLEVRHGKPEGVLVVPHGVPRREGLELQPAHGLDGRVRVRVGLIPGVGKHRAGLVLHRHPDHVPGGERGDLFLRQAKFAAQKLKHGGVGIQNLIVAGDEVVSRLAGEDFRVAGIGKK